MNKYLLITDRYGTEQSAYLTTANNFEEALTTFYEYFGGGTVLTTGLFEKAIKNELSEIAIKLFEKEHDKVIFFGIIHQPFVCNVSIAERKRQ